MSAVLAPTRSPHAPGDDQAAGLRRLFAARRTRLLPVLAGGATSGQSRWLAQLGEAFARAGEQTVLVDGSRAQIAATLGLRARYDLLHALERHCTAADVQLDAAPGLVVVPAARACERAVEAGVSLPALLAPVLNRRADVVLALLPAAWAQLLPPGDVLVPVLPTRRSVGAALAAIAAAAGRQGTLTFRLLFLAMDRPAAATLGRRMAESIGTRSQARFAPGVVAPVARDLAQVVAAASSFALASAAPPVSTARRGEFK